MKKNRYIICLIALMIVSLQAVAQNRERNNGRNGRENFDREAFMATRNTYITQKTGLTAEEAAVFIPLENELMRKNFEVGRECLRLERELREKKVKTNEEYEKVLKCRTEVAEKRAKLDKEYMEKFKKVLSAEKILKYQNAAMEFMNEYMQNRNR